MTKRFTKPHAAVPVSRPRRLAVAIGRLLAGSVLLDAITGPAWAELPVPADVLVAPGAGIVMPPTISGNTMTINQLSDKATLDWKSFNIGPSNTVRFEQPRSSSIALNNIHQADPSRIFGALTANGQVFLVNQNGFVFGKDSQVNVNTLVASSLHISADTFQQGIARAFEQGQAALSAVDGKGQPTRQLYLKDASGQPLIDGNGQKVKIQILVEAGANIKTNAPDGRIILAAPSITNRGTLEAADGQVIMAASQDKVYLQLADSASGIKGFLVEIGAGGEVNNIGKVLAERGNASLIGFAVNQNGLVSASTSVRINGSVRLLAREGIQDPTLTNGMLKPLATKRANDLGDGLGASATVNLGPGSLTQVALDADKSQTAIDSQTQQASRVEIAGHKVFLRENASVQAKAGKVAVTAVDDPTKPAIQGDARIYLESGSRIDVSGVKNVSLPMESNMLKVELRKNEMRDAPLQKDGILYGKTVSVDLRDAIGAVGGKHIPIADLQGALDRIARNIDERSTSGGTISLKSTGDLITRPGSLLDFSGGSVSYRDGYLATTKLMDAEGRIHDIGKADPNLRYVSIFGEWIKEWTKWGVTETWSIPGPLGKGAFEKGYVQGASAGTLDISAFEAMLDGIFQGGAVDGIRQRRSSERADGGSLHVDLNPGGVNHQDVVFASRLAVDKLGPNDPLPRNAPDSRDPLELTIAPGLFKDSGIRHASIITSGSVTVSEGARVEMPAGGSLALSGLGFEVQGTIVARSGDVELRPSSSTLPSPITLGASALIDVSGLWVNDWLDKQEGRALSPVAIDGGTVSLNARQGNLTLAAGSRIDASGGAWLPGDMQLQAGHGGTIHLSAATTFPGNPSSSLVLGGQLAGWALQEGGSMSLETNEVLIGPAGAAPLRPGSKQTPLVLPADFFQQGGFADYAIKSNVFGIKVAEGIQLTPRQGNLALSKDAYALPTGADPFQAVKTVLPDRDRRPANLTLTYAGLMTQKPAESLSIGKGALIRTDPLGQVRLNSDTSIVVDGAIEAPAGQIGLTITAPSSSSADTGFFASQGIWLGPGSRLSAQGMFKAEPALNGFRKGQVLDGGSITLAANRGYIVAQKDSLLDVSGALETLDFWQESTEGRIVQTAQRDIASSGGSLSLTAAEGVILDSTLNAKAGATGAAGGALKVELNRLNANKAPPEEQGGKNLFPDDVNPNQPQSIVVSAAAESPLPAGLTQGGNIPTRDFNGRAWLNSEPINDGGFSSITLKTEGYNLSTQKYAADIQFRGDASLRAEREIILDSPSLAWAALTPADKGLVALEAAYVALGSTQSRIDTDLGSGIYSTRLAPEARTGKGQFNVKAEGIDLIGGLSFSGFGRASLASSGDVRARGIGGTRTQKNYQGELKFAGDLIIKADQIYPATLADYRIAVSGADSQGVTLQTTGEAAAPVYSAAGSLSINAPNIHQQGALKAPFGSLSLNAANSLELAAGSLTSVSGDGLTIPFGRGSANQYWLYPIDSRGSSNIVFDAPPEKRISLNGKNVALRGGATIDLSGGGDLYAHEFIPGPGGSHDVLEPGSGGYAGSFAVLPGAQNLLTPYDPLEFASAGLKVGDSVHLGGAAGLPAGQYTLMPAHYALLPGAYLVTPRSDVGELAPGQARTDAAGTSIVAGRYGAAGTAIADARWHGFAVEPGEIARTRSEFKDYSSNRFYADKSARDETALPQLARDAGSLAIAATSSLSLGSRVNAGAAGGGRGGQVDIGGDKLAIVGRREDLAGAKPGTVAILADELNAMNVPSLLLGGARSRDKAGQRVTVSAQSVNIAGNADLKGAEILLAARDLVKLEAGAMVESRGKSPDSQSILFISNQKSGDSDGGLVWLSSAGQVDVIRDRQVSGNTGTLVVEAGAKLKSEGSMLLDSTKDTVFAGDILMQGGSLSLKSSKISLGNAQPGTPGLVLAKTGFDLDVLKLASASDLNLHGGINLSAKRLDIQAAAINGFDNAGASSLLSGDLIRLHNAGAKTGAVGTGTGSLALNAREILLGAGNYAITGFGQVALNATESIQGQGRTTDPATQKDLPAGAGKLTVAGDLSVSAGSIRGEAGATTLVDASGHGVTLSATAGGNLGEAGLGASWSITGDSILGNGRFDLPSGILSLKALSGDLILGAGTHIDLSGRGQTFDAKVRFSPAGKLTLQADPLLDARGKPLSGGNVRLDSGSIINLAGALDATGAQASDAGSLDIRARSGQFIWNGVIDAVGGAALNPELWQGRFRLDVASLGEDGFSNLNARLRASGFTESASLHLRSGNVDIAKTDTVKAKQFELQADQGAVTIEGRIDASGTAGGQVSIYGRNGIALAASGEIDASASGPGAEGGKVSLDTVHRDDSGSGLLNFSSGSSIRVSAGANGVGGAIHLRTGRSEAPNAILQARLAGANPLRTILEATETYSEISSITASNIAGWQTDTANFMAGVAQPGNPAITLLPGIEVRSSGNLTLQDRWDFMDGQWLPDLDDPNGIVGNWQSNWRYADATGQNGLPGFLTLRAGGDLNINASLTDAFGTTPIPGIYSFLRFQDLLQPGESWSYHLAAGGNINLAPAYSGPDPADPASGATVDGLQVMVRTGTGDIGLEAGGDINFVAAPNNPQAAAAVYTMGRPAQYTMADVLSALQGNAGIPGIPGPNPGESQTDYLQRLNTIQMNELLRYGYLNVSFDDIALPAARFLAEYPSHGGSVSLAAGGNIKGVQTGQLMTDWMVRSGAWDSANGGAANSPTAWGINVSSDFNNETVLPSFDGSYFYFGKGNRSFNQNVGALGGGNVSIFAGGDVLDLSAMLPVTGKPFGIWNEQRQWVSNDDGVVNGGGDLQVSAGGDIVGGEYYVGLGQARLDAGGSIANSTSGLGTLAALSHAGFQAQARGDVNLGSAFNPTVAKQKISTDPMNSDDSYFFTYSPQSSLSLSSLAGDVVLQNDTRAIKASKGLDVNVGSGFEFAVYPGTLKATALSGDIRIDNSFTLFPSPDGKLELLAEGNIGADVPGRRINVNVSDADPAFLPGLFSPAKVLDGNLAARQFEARERLDPMNPYSAIIHAKTPLHQGSAAKSSIIARSGDIAFPSSTPFWWYLPNASEFQAGRDIRNLSLAGQNLADTDITLVQAGRDIRYDTPLDGDGLVLAIDRKIQLGGPGELMVLTGRNLNLGSSTGLLTVGNLANTALPPAKGAAISVLTGLSDKVDSLGFLNHYFGEGGKYSNELDQYQFVLHGNTGTISYGPNPGLQGEILSLSRTEKLEILQRLPRTYSLAFVTPYFFNELKLSASAAAAEKDEAKRLSLYRPGFDAIQTLFPGEGYQGDLALVFSQIKTLAGGDINLLVPGGKVDVGLAGKNGGITKKADQLGIVVQQAGNLSGLAKGDINVNQSRVFTLYGGDILLWSSTGDIDAGKGAKGTISAPPPITTIDQDGNPQTIFPPVVSGSGIRAVSPEDKAKRQGSVTLAAPSGIVDAGEAGIGGDRVVIAATAVIGASNIQASGGTVGVPATVAAPVVVPGADAAAAGVAKSTTDQLAETAANKPPQTDDKAANPVASTLQADVVGFGPCSVGDVREGKAGCGG